MAGTEPEPTRVVSQRALHLLNGCAGLHELGHTGQGQLIALLDSGVSIPELDFAIASRDSVTSVPATRAVGEHGDRMATAIVQAAPSAKLAVVNVFRQNGLVLRSDIAAGLALTTSRPDLRIVNLSLGIRRAATECTDANLCAACTATAALVDEGRLVVVAAGNFGPDAPTCPGSAPGALSVGATIGPTGTSRSVVGQPLVSGTSISGAIVTGAIACLSSAVPNLTNSELQLALRATITTMTAGPAVTRYGGQPHFYRAYKHIEHVRNGGTADEFEAQNIVNEFTEWPSLPAGAALPELIGAMTAMQRHALSAVIEHALSFAPWSANLTLFRSLLMAAAGESAAAENAVAEALRLDWTSVATHNQLANLLIARDPFGAATEREVAARLVADDELGAADVLFDALAQRRSATPP